MSLSIGTPVFENNSSGQNDSTTISVTASAGSAIYWLNYRRSKAVTTTAPVFNGETFTSLVSPIDTGEALLDLYRLVVPSGKGGTFNVTSSLSAFAWYNTGVAVITPTGSISETVATPQIYNSGTYSSPSISLGTVATGNIALSFLAAMDWDTGYGNPGANWSSVAPATNRGSITNSSTSAINKLNIQSSVGSGSALSTAWLGSAPGSMYTHLAVVVSEAAATSVSLTTPVVVGGTGYSATTSGLAAVTSLTNATITGTGSNSFTYSMNSWQNGVAYLAIGASRTQTASDGSASAGGTITLNPPAGYTTVTLVNPIDTGDYALGKDPAFVSAAQVSLPTSAGTLNADSTLTDYVFGTYAGWMRDPADGKMYSFTLSVTNSGISIGSNHIVATPISASIIGSTVISARTI